MIKGIILFGGEVNIGCIADVYNLHIFVFGFRNCNHLFVPHAIKLIDMEQQFNQIAYFFSELFGVNRFDCAYILNGTYKIINLSLKMMF